MSLTHFFTKDEFNRNGENWYDEYDPRCLVLLDTFRLHTGRCILSPHPRGLGRRDGKNDKTGYDAHNIDKHGKVMGVDCFPNLPTNMTPYESIHKAFHVAKNIGITGIGIYPQWKLDGKTRCGMHLDTRRHVTPGKPVTWGYLNGKFVPIETAFNFLIQQSYAI